MKAKKQKKLVELFNIKLKSVDKDSGTLEAIFSTADEDRHGDVVKQDWDLKSYKKNPVIIDSHDYNDATKVVGKAMKVGMDEKGKNLTGKIKFAVDENPRAKIIFDLYAGGFLNAFSVGFLPKEFDDKGVILKSELLEVSVVSIPANARALAKKKGINVDLLTETKDGQPNKNNDDNKKSVARKKSKKSDNGKGKRKKVKKADKDGKPAGNEVVKKEFERWDETNEYVRYKVRDIDEFGTLSRIVLKTEFPKIEATVGTLKLGEPGKGYVQMLFFPKADGWTTDDTKKWLMSNKNKSVDGAVTNEAKDVKEAVSTIDKKAGKMLLIRSAVEMTMEKRINGLKRIGDAISIVSEATSDLQGSSSVRKAESIKLINRSVKSLLKLKGE